MLYNLLVSVGGVVLLLGAWVAVQSLVRRNHPAIDEEPDVLACHMCGADGACHCGLKPRLRTANKKVDLQ